MTRIIRPPPSRSSVFRLEASRTMRQDVEFPSRGQMCRGWFYPPENVPEGQAAPAVVMAHGFSGVKEQFLSSFAERFADAGLAVLVFDFRFLGASDGQPRQQIFPHEQHEDFRNAITYASRRPEIDAARIGAWGTSYSGGHVMHLTAFDRRIKAAVAQVPAICIWRQMLRQGGREALDGLTAMLALDREARFDGGPVNTAAVVAPPGQPGALPTADSYEFFETTTGIAPSWRNEVTIESLERMIEYDPTGALELIAPTPLLVIAAANDSLIAIDGVREAIARAGESGELLVLDCGHFDVYATEPWFDRASSAASAWFAKHLG